MFQAKPHAVGGVRGLRFTADGHMGSSSGSGTFRRSGGCSGSWHASRSSTRAGKRGQRSLSTRRPDHRLDQQRAKSDPADDEETDYKLVAVSVHELRYCSLTREIGLAIDRTPILRPTPFLFFFHEDRSCGSLKGFRALVMSSNHAVVLAALLASLPRVHAKVNQL